MKALEETPDERLCCNRNTMSEIMVQFLDITYVSTKENILIGHISDVVLLWRESDFFA